MPLSIRSSPVLHGTVSVKNLTVGEVTKKSAIFMVPWSTGVPTSPTMLPIQSQLNQVKILILYLRSTLISSSHQRLDIPSCPIPSLQILLLNSESFPSRWYMSLRTGNPLLDFITLTILRWRIHITKIYEDSWRRLSSGFLRRVVW
jgi:hypothetical protein